MNKFLLTLAASVFILSATTAQNCSSIFISEYIEGWSNNKALEIYNPTDQPVDMSNYQLHRWNNGTAIYDPNYTLVLSGTIPPKGVIVYVRDSSQGGVWNQLKAKADVYLTPSCDLNSTDRTFCFNGNDALTLELKNRTVIDGLGYIGDDPGNPTAGGGWNDVPPAFQAADSTEFAWTTNKGLVRKYSVQKGSIPPSKPASQPAWNVSLEWDSFAVNRFDSLGFHRCACNEQTGIKAAVFAKFELYPNPTSSFLFVSAEEEIAEVLVTDLQGKVAIRRKYFQNNIELNLRDAELNDGLYLVKVRTAQNKTASKVVQLVK